MHSLYPMPDKVMVWHKKKPEIRSALKAKGNLELKLAEAADQAKPKEDPELPAEAASGPPGVLVSTSVGPVPGTVYVWASDEDVKSRQVNNVLQGIRDLHDFHTLSGHRSAPTTAMQYAWIYGKTMPLEVRNNQRRCPACDEARIREEPFRKTALLDVQIGDEYNVDTIVSMPLSHSG